VGGGFQKCPRLSEAKGITLGRGVHTDNAGTEREKKFSIEDHERQKEKESQRNAHKGVSNQRVK